MNRKDEPQIMAMAARRPQSLRVYACTFVPLAVAGRDERILVEGEVMPAS